RAGEKEHPDAELEPAVRRAHIGDCRRVGQHDRYEPGHVRRIGNEGGPESDERQSPDDEIQAPRGHARHSIRLRPAWSEYTLCSMTADRSQIPGIAKSRRASGK